MPDRNHKYRNEAIIEPARVIEERKKVGLHPSCLVPTGAVVCYDSTFWQWVRARLDVVECDGWLKGAYLVPSGWFDKYDLMELMGESGFYPTNRQAAVAFRQAAEQKETNHVESSLYFHRDGRDVLRGHFELCWSGC